MNPLDNTRSPHAHPRKPVRLPSWESLPPVARETAHRADWAIAALAAKARGLPNAGLNASLPPPTVTISGLHHELTPLFAPVDAPIYLSGACTEYCALTAHAAELRAAIASGTTSSFVDAISAISVTLTGNPRLRDRPVRTSSDQAGRFVVFPPPLAVPVQLGRIARALHVAADQPMVFRAMLALVGISNCHPLCDGNGRTSRIIANAIMNDPAVAPDFYLPIREIAVFSRGGYLVRVRQAELQDDWLPLASFLLTAVTWWTAKLDEQVFSHPGAGAMARR